jgi:hypothetical protein
MKITDILNKYVVGSGFDCYAVIPALIDHIGKLDVVAVHGVEAVRVLYPVGSVWGTQSRGVNINIIEPCVRPIHDVDAPKWRLEDTDYKT